MSHKPKFFNNGLIEIISLLNQYGMRIEEYFLCYLVYLCETPAGSQYLYRYVEGMKKERKKFLKGISYDTSSFSNDSLEILVKKGIIIEPKSRDLGWDYLTLNPIWADKLFGSTIKLGEELYQNYPPYIEGEGKKYPARNVTKKYGSLDEFFFEYSISICHDKELHKKILKALEVAKKFLLL